MSIDPKEHSPRGATGRQTVSGENRTSPQSDHAGDGWRREHSIASVAKTSAHENGQSLDAADDLVDKAKEAARATAKAFSSQAAELVGNIGSELSETADEQKSRGADAMLGFAKAVRGAASDLDEQSPTVARYIRTAAASVEELSDSIRSRKVTDLITTATDTARTHPTAFFIGAVAAGFALSRFLRSTARTSAADAGREGLERRSTIGNARQGFAGAASENSSGFEGRS